MLASYSGDSADGYEQERNMINRVKGGLVRRVVSLAELVLDQLRVHTCNVRSHEILLHAESEIEK